MSPSSRATNGHPPEQADSKPTARQIKDITQAALDNIASTVRTSRDVFENSSSSSSIAESVLGYIQSDSTVQSSAYASLPTELQLTTESLLMTLPSSTHFMLLPPHLKFYKPAVDVNSPKSRVAPADLRREGMAWLEKATTSLKVSLDRWFLDLSTVKDVWTTRHSLRKWILSFNAFQEQETRSLSDIIDAACRKRISAIWKLILSQAETSFGESILHAVSSFNEHQIGSASLSTALVIPLTRCRCPSYAESLSKSSFNVDGLYWTCGRLFSEIQVITEEAVTGKNCIVGRGTQNTRILCPRTAT